MLDHHHTPNNGGHRRFQTKTSPYNRHPKARGFESCPQPEDRPLASPRADTRHTSEAASSQNGRGTSSRRSHRLDSAERCNHAELSSWKSCTYIQTSQPRSYRDIDVHDIKVSTNQNRGNSEKMQSLVSKSKSSPTIGERQHLRSSYQDHSSDTFGSELEPGNYRRHQKQPHGYAQRGYVVSSLGSQRTLSKYRTAKKLSNFQNGKDEETEMAVSRHSPCLTHRDERHPPQERVLYAERGKADRNSTLGLLSDPKTDFTENVSKPHLAVQPIHDMPRSYHSNLLLGEDQPCAHVVLPFSETISIGNTVRELLPKPTSQLENCNHDHQMMVVGDRETTESTQSKQSSVKALHLSSSNEKNESVLSSMQDHSFSHEAFLNPDANEFSPQPSSCHDSTDTTQLKQVYSSISWGNEKDIQNESYPPEGCLVDTHGKTYASDFFTSSLEAQQSQIGVWSHMSPYTCSNINYVDPSQHVYSPSMPVSYSCFPIYAPGFASSNQPHQVSQDSTASTQCPLCMNVNSPYVAHNPFYSQTMEVTPTFVPTVPGPSQPAAVQPLPGYTVYLPMYANASPFTPAMNLQEARHTSGSHSTSLTTPIFSVTPQFNNSAQLVYSFPELRPSYAFQATSAREPVFNLQKYFQSATQDIAENTIDTNAHHQDGFLTSLKSDKNIQVDVSNRVEHVKCSTSQGNSFSEPCHLSDHTTGQSNPKLSPTSCPPTGLQNLASTVASKLSADDKAMFEECKRLLTRLASKKVSVDWLHSRVSSEQEKQRRAMQGWLRLALQVIQEKGQILTLDEMVAVMLEPKLRQDLKC